MATEKEIKEYCIALFVGMDLDWHGYIALRKYEKACLEKMEIIPMAHYVNEHNKNQYAATN